MPIVNHVADAMKKKYGKDWKKHYFALENSGKLDQAKKTAAKEGPGHSSANLKAYEKSKAPKSSPVHGLAFMQAIKDRNATDSVRSSIFDRIHPGKKKKVVKKGSYA